MEVSEALNCRMGWGERIRTARNAKGLSQAQLGDAIGKSQQTVAGYEAETSEPELSIFDKIAKATGYQYGWLVIGSGHPTNNVATGNENHVDRHGIREAIVIFERVMGEAGLQYSPEEKASLILAGYALAMREGGPQALESVFRRVLAAAT